MAEFQPTKMKPLWTLPFEGNWPSAVAFISDELFAAANRDGHLYLWKLPAQSSSAPPVPVRRLEGHTNSITRLLSPRDGKTLISASCDRTVRVWDVTSPASGQGEAILDAETREKQAKKEGKKYVAPPPVKVEVQTQSRVLGTLNDWINALGLSGDGKRVIAGSDRSEAVVWELATGKEVSRIAGVAPNSWVCSTALTADGKTALVSEWTYKKGDSDSVNPGLRLINADDGSLKLDLFALQFPKEADRKNVYSYGKFFAMGLVASAFSPDGKIVALGQGGEDGDGKTHLLDTETGKLIRTIGGHRYGSTDLQFSPDGKLVISVGRDTQVRVTQVADGKEVIALGKARGGQFYDWLHAVDVSPNLKRIAAADIGGSVIIYEAA